MVPLNRVDPYQHFDFIRIMRTKLNQKGDPPALPGWQ